MLLNVETNTPSSFTTAEISIFTPIPLLEDKISLSPAASNLTVGVMIVFFLTPFPIVLIAFLSSSKFVLNFIIIFPFFITVMPLFLFCIFNMPNKIFHKKITADFFCPAAIINDYPAIFSSLSLFNLFNFSSNSDKSFDLYFFNNCCSTSIVSIRSILIFVFFCSFLVIPHLLRNVS